MLFGGGHGNAAESHGRKQSLDAVKKLNVVKRRRHDDHGRIVEKVCPRIFEARFVRTGHGVSAKVGDAVFLGDGKAHGADLALCAACIDDDGLFTDMRCHAF